MKSVCKLTLGDSSQALVRKVSAHSCRSAKRRAWTSRSASWPCQPPFNVPDIAMPRRATAKSLREEGSRDHPLKVRAGALA
jgi:hypothetical protein